MKTIHIFLEGPSDKFALEKLFAKLIDTAANQGDIIRFYYEGDKKLLLNKGPEKALNILRNTPESYIFLIPDLYPQNLPFPHTTYDELKNQLDKRFKKKLQDKQCDARLKERFFVHCFKYDLEVLLLASEISLKNHLSIKSFPITWTKPVEDQDHGYYPKSVIEKLFNKCGKKYKDTYDAPLILQNSDYIQLMSMCNQNFKPFVDDLLRILNLQT